MNNALIWGAGGGIGRALAAHLQQAGWQVAGITRRPEQAPAGLACAAVADVGNAFQVRQAVLEVAQALGEVNLWVYAVGDIAAAPVESMHEAVWSRLQVANLSGAYLTTHHSRPLLAKDAHLIFLGAVHERLRLPGLGAYAAAKAGLEAFAEALQKEERTWRVTVVRPGAVDTPLWTKMPVRLPRTAITPDELATRLLALHADVVAGGKKGIVDL
jgi:3-oxoacyl-[acyl-carrier protein] reductase